MKKGYVNWKLVLVLLLAVCAVGATVVGLRKYNRTQRASRGLKTGLQAFEQKQWRPAAAGLGQYLAVNPSNVEILVKYGHAQARSQPFKVDHYRQAVNAYRSVLREEADNLEAAESLIDLYLQANQPGEAELVATRFLAHTKNPEILRRLAMAQLMQNKHEEAAELLTDLVVRQPDQIQSYEMLSYLARQHSNLVQKSPQEWVEAAVANNPEKAEAYILRGTYSARMGQRELAVRDYEQAGRCQIPEVETRLTLATAWLRIEGLEQASEQLDLVYAEDPRRAELWQLRALLANKQQDGEKALRVAREGLEQLGDGKAVFLPYAVELFLLGNDIDGTRSAMEQLRQTEVSRGLVSYLDGLLSEREGDWPAATRHWREAIIHGHTSESVYLKLADAFLRMDDRASAIEMLRRYISQNPRSFSSQLMLSQILAQDGQWQEASEYAAAAARLNPDSQQAQTLHDRSRIEVFSEQPQTRDRADQLLTELLAADDSLSTRQLAFRVMLRRQDMQAAKEALEVLKERYGHTVEVRLAEVEYELRQGRQDAAAEKLDAIIAEFPNAVQPVILRSAQMIDAGQADEALALMQAASARLEGADRRRVLLWEADFYRRQGHRQAVIDLFTNMAEENPHDIFVRRQLLSLHRADGQMAKLQEWIDQIKQIEGATGRLWKFEQVSLWLARESIDRYYSRIVNLLNENLAANPDDKQSLMLLAAAHEMAGNRRLAVSVYRDTLTRHPGDIDLAIAAIGAMYRADEYRQAEQLLADLLSAGHSDPRLAQLELQSHMRQGRTDAVEQMLEEMLAAGGADAGARVSLALLKTRNGEFDAAKVLIDELLEEAPDAIAPHAALVDWHLQQNQQDKAIAVCNAYLHKHQTLEAYRLRARVLLAVNRREEAVSDIEYIMQHAFENAEMLLNVSELYAAAGLLDEALVAARGALALDADMFDAKKQMAQLLLSRPQTHQEGWEFLNTALERRPRDAQLRLRKATLLLERGDSASSGEAVTILNALVGEFPRMDAAWQYLVDWYLRSEQTGMAMDTVLRGLAVQPENRMLLMYKSQIEARRSPAVALDTLNNLAQRHPGDAVITELRSQLLRRLDRTGQAVELVQGWLAENASTQPAQATRMKIPLMGLLYEDGKIEQAKALYEELSENSEVAVTALVQWIRLIASGASAQECVAAFQRWYDNNPQGGAVSLPVLENLLASQRLEAAAAAETIIDLVYSRQPDSPDVTFAMAMYRHMTGNAIEAVPYYERTLELAPNNLVAANNLAWILSRDMGMHDKALKLADKALAQAPNYTDLIDTRGAIHYALGNYEKSAADYRAAAERYSDSQPKKTAAIFYLARSLKQLGRIEQATTAFFRARELNQRNGGLDEQQRAELNAFLQEHL